MKYRYLSSRFGISICRLTYPVYGLTNSINLRKDEQIKQNISQIARQRPRPLIKQLKKVWRELFRKNSWQSNGWSSKCLKCASISEFNAKENKIRFAANNEILEKINQAISTIEKVNVEKFQEMSQDNKKLLLKQQKLIPIVNTEEDDWEVLNFIWLAISLLTQKMKSKC